MTASSTYGRQVIIPLTNKSGGSVIAGDVVIVDTTNNDAFTTTTSAGFTGGVGIAQDSIANNAVGRVLTQGYAALVLVNASVTRGNFGKTHTVAKQATDAGSSRGVGTFCQFLTGGTTPDAVVFPVDLGGTALTNPMTTKGDIIQADTGGTPLRLGAGTSGYVLTAAGAGNLSAWGYPVLSYLRNQLSGPVTMTTAGTFYDGPAVTLSAGTWQLHGTVSMEGTAAANAFTAKLWDGSTVTARSKTTEVAGGYCSISLHDVVVIASGTPTWKISVTSGTNSCQIDAATSEAAGNNASTLIAIRIA